MNEVCKLDQEEEKFRDMGAYLRNANDIVEVAINEGKYYEEYTVRHMPKHMTEQKILAELASHFRTQGFRVMLFQYETRKNSHSFLRIMWSENPYNYPEERSFVSSVFGLFRKKASAKRPILFGRAKDAYNSVLEKDVVTESAIELMLYELHHDFLTSVEPLVLQRKDLDRILLPLSDLDGSVLPKLNTMKLIHQLEADGLHVEVQRMFQFTIKPDGRKKLL